MAYTLQQLSLAWTVAHNGIGPNATVLADLGNRAAQNAAGAMTDAQAMSFVVNSVDNSTTLAAVAYQFFTGKSPTKDGLAYLVHSDANDRDLNDPYYANFGLTDRYINFGANLGFIGEGKETFAAKYGAMNMNDFVASIYETIIGSTYASAAGKDPQQEIRDILRRVPAAEINASNTGLVNGLSTAAERDLATKATLAGFVLGEAIRTDIGIYAAAANNFILAVATGTATYNTDITTTYAPTPGQGVGSPVTTAPPTETVPGYVAPPPPPPPPPPSATPHSFTLTTGADTFNGDSLVDTFTGTLGTSATLNANDVLRGAGGDDTLTITSDAGSSFSYDATKITGIEHLSVTATGGATFQYLDGIAFTDLTNTGSTVDVHFNEAAPTSKLKIANTTASTYFETPNTGLSGSTDAMTLTLSDVTGAAGVTINDGAGSLNQYETLNIVSNGTANAIKLGTDTHQTSLATIDISGAAPLTLTFAAGGDHVTTNNLTIDSHTATGGVTIGSYAVPLGGGNNTITLGTGANVVFFGNNALNTNDTVTATAGTNDTLVISDTAITSGNLTHVTGIETFRFMSPTGPLTQDVTQLPSGVNLEVDGANSDVRFTNVDNNATVNVLNAIRVQMTLAADTGSDALTVKLAPTTTGGTTLSLLTNVLDLETLNIVSNGAAGQSAANVIGTDSVTAQHVLTGSADLTINGALATTSFDASAFTGKLTATARAGGTSFIGGTGADTLNGGAGNDTFWLGAQGVNAQSGADTITTNSSGDTVIFVGNAANGTGAATSLSAAASIRGTSGGANVTGLTVAFSANDNDFSLKNFAGTAFTGLAKGGVAHGLTAGDAMVVQTLGTSGTFSATTDVSVIQLTSSAPFSGGVDIKQLFANAIGSAMISGLAANGNYVVSLYDSTASQTLFAVVNVGASAAGNAELTAADFTNGGVALIGHVSTPSIMSGITLGTAI